MRLAMKDTQAFLPWCGRKCPIWNFPRVKCPTILCPFWEGEGAIYCCSGWSWSFADSATHHGSSQRRLSPLKYQWLFSINSNCSSRENRRMICMMCSHYKREGNRCSKPSPIFALFGVVWNSSFLTREVQGNVLHGICGLRGLAIALNWLKMLWPRIVIVFRREMQ